MRQRNRAGVLILVIAVVTGLAITASFSVGRAYRSINDPTIGLAARPAFVSAPDPVKRAEQGLDPNSTDEAPGVSRVEMRTIQVLPDVINLLQGGELTRSIRLAQPVTTPDQIVDLVNDEGWIGRSAPTEILLNAGLVMEPGTVLTVAAPLRRIVLEARQGVLLAGSEANLTFDGVDVEASDRAVPKDGEVGPGTRPFVLAAGGSMEIRNSTFRYLGRDWNGSYGVSWTKGATGSAAGSTFEHGFMGLFAATAIDVRFTRNKFRDNTLFGINAHTTSAGLLVAGNVAERNGRDGILLSDHVTNSEIRDNVSQDNRLSGITVDASSDSNVISGNIADSNHGDGIIVSGGSHNKIIDNTIRNNRVAVGAYGVGATSNTAQRNTIDGNGLATQGIDSAGNIVLSNGDYWRPVALVVIWVAAALLAWVLCLLTRWSQRRRDNDIARSNSDRVLLNSGVSQ